MGKFFWGGFIEIWELGVGLDGGFGGDIGEK